MKTQTSIAFSVCHLSLAIVLGLLCTPSLGLCQTPIVCGQTVTSTTSSAAQIDQYTFAGTAGQVLSFALWGPISCNNDYMVADIYSPTGQLVAGLSSVCNAGNALNLTLTNTGTYTVLVHESFYRATASYSLSIQSVVGGGCNTRTITCGQTVATNTDFNSQMDAYSYVGSAGQVLSIALWGPISCPYDYMVADIYGPNGQLVTNLSSVCNTGNALILTLTNTGTYTVLVHESLYRSTVSYSLSIQSATGGGCHGTPLNCGQTLNSQIVQASEIVSHDLPANAGEHIILSASGFAGMLVDLYDPRGTNIASIGPSGTANLTLALTGIYTLLVHDGNYAGTGTYGLSLTVFGGCTRLSLGSGVVRTQQVVCLPLEMVATSPAVWVSFAVKSPDGILTSPTVNATPPFTNATVTPGSNSQWLVSMRTSPTSGVSGDQIIGSLCFMAVSTQSLFAPIVLNSLVVTNQGGLVPGASAFGGRTVVIANRPLLESWRATNGQRMVTTYGKANTAYEMQQTTNVGAAASWISGWTNTVPPSLFYASPIQGPLSNAPIVFLRAKEE
jgi:hypothetical protein